jgi:hypothetical protein
MGSSSACVRTGTSSAGLMTVPTGGVVKQHSKTGPLASRDANFVYWLMSPPYVQNAMPQAFPVSIQFWTMPVIGNCVRVFA